jgi:anti-sigma-K factor RskA
VSDAQHHPFDEVALYALDALDPAENAAIEAHLAGCSICQGELDEHRATLARLTADEPAQAGVWLRLSSELGSTAGPGPDLHLAPGPAEPPPAPKAVPRARRRAPRPTRPRHLAPRRPRWQAAALAAAAALLVVAGLGLGYVLGNNEEPTDLAHVAQDALDEPGAPVANLATADGRTVARVVLTDRDTGYLFADALPTLPQGRTYQLWRADTAQPVSLGLIGNGTTPITAFAVPPDTKKMAISAEAAGGAVVPTANQIIASGAVAP